MDFGTLAQHAFWRTLWYPATAVLSPARISGTNLGCIPEDGPVLILANHVNWLDPFYLGWLMPRPLHYMASAPWFDNPVLGPLLKGIGAFPKKKFTRDSGAIEAVNRLWKRDTLVGIYPEGRRSWDGRPAPVRPNIGKLILKLDARVVYARSLTGHLHEPRWARHPRFVPVRFELEGPVTYPQDTPYTQVAEDVARRIHVDVRNVQLPRGSRGWRLAEGLPGYLWACPHCFEPESLAVVADHRDRVRCEDCGSTWELDLRHSMHARGGPAADTTVYDASDALEAHFGWPPRIPDLPDPDVVLQDQGRILDVGKGNEKTERCRGTLQLDPSELRLVQGGSTPWRLPLDELVAASIEGTGALQFRSPDGLVQVDLGAASPYKWQRFVLAWRGQRTGKENP